MQSKTHSFSVSSLLNPNTDLPFGSKYDGTFTVRLASIRDKTFIAQKEAAERNAFGNAPVEQIPTGLELARYIYFFITTVATEKVPEWFDRDKIFDEDDEAAMLAVWQEVQTFQNSFRPDRAC